jgi:prophage regulatory protein
MSSRPSSGFHILRRREVQERLGIARSTLYAYGDRRSPQFKPDFPQPIRLGSVTGFVEHEIDEYVLSLMQAREGGLRR